MEAINTLMSYSLTEVVTILLCAVIAIKFLWSIIEWFSDKFKQIFKIQNAKEKADQEFKDTIVSMTKKIDDKEVQFTDAILTIKNMIEELKGKIGDLEQKENLTQERIQQDSRAYLIDKHKRYTEAGWIDTHALENLEIRYMYYKAAGGNTFVDGLMTDLRKLPMVAPGKKEGV